MADITSTIALNRFGYGARPGDLERVGSNPRAWLLQPFTSKDAFILEGRDLVSSQEAMRRFSAFRMARKAEERGQAQMDEQKMRSTALQDLRDLSRDTVVADTEARTDRGISATNSFPERWVRFWANWFTAAATKAAMVPLAGPFEREAIRPNVTGSFQDLLMASTFHPGMLVYLDQAQSIGPNSQAGRRRDAGLNENLAREVLELHTIGAEGGYSQTDVTEFARALTGHTLVGERTQRFFPNALAGTAVFVPQMHEPGDRTIMGKNYGGPPDQQATRVLATLANHPATAKRVAMKLASHFVADNPPPTLVARLETTFKQSRGSLSALAAALVTSEEAWAPTPAKFKTPDDFLMSSLRACGIDRVSVRELRPTFEQLGQPPFRAPSPKGWPDDAASWAAPDAILKRADWANQLAAKVGESINPVSFAQAALGPALTEHTRIALSRAESGRQGLVLALMSPEFQRR